MRELAKRFFVFNPEGDCEINSEVETDDLSEKDKISLLLEIISQWDNVFCLHDREDNFGYHIVRRCPKCIFSQKVLDKIFGDSRNFEKLPFVGKNENFIAAFSLKEMREYVR